MPRPKKDGKYLNLCIRSDIYDRFDSFCENTGRIKTTALEMILTQYLDEYDKTHSQGSGNGASDRKTIS